MTSALPAAFEPSAVAAVADETGRDASTIRADLDAVQAVVAGFDALTVDDLVYEWRTRHHKDPLVSRTPETYYLDVRDHVWKDVLSRADGPRTTAAVIRAVHSKQFAADVEGDAPSGAMVLARS